MLSLSSTNLIHFRFGLFLKNYTHSLNENFSTLKLQIYTTFLLFLSRLFVRLDFTKSFKRVLGDGASILFWQHEWLSHKALGDKYERLLAWEMKKDFSIQDHLCWNGADFSWCRSWQRDPLGREVGELKRLLFDIRVVLQKQGWVILGNATGPLTIKYTVTKLAVTLDEIWVASSDTPTMRCKSLLKKVNIFLWRARRNFLPCMW